MKLFHKIASTLLLTVGAAIIAAFAAVFAIFLPQYETMDRDASHATALRVQGALQREINALQSVTGDWANWTDTYDFSNDLNASFRENNLTDTALDTIHVDEFIITDLNGRLITTFRTSGSKANGNAALASLNKFPAHFWPKPESLTPRKKFAGLIKTEAGPTIIAMTRITDSKYEKNADRVLVLVKPLDQSMTAAITEQSGSEFHLVTHVQAEKVITTDEGLSAFVDIADHLGQPAYSVRVDTKPTFTLLAQSTMKVIGSILVLIGVITGAVLLIFMRYVVTMPLEAIITHSQAVSATANLDRRLNNTRSDEIGILARAYDEMLDQLKLARLQLQEASYAAGKSNAVADLLHNIRNALSPISTAVWKGRTALNQFNWERFARASSELKNDSVDPARREKLLAYVDETIKQGSEQKPQVENQFGLIEEFSSQIEAVLNHYDNVSKGFQAAEEIPVNDVVATATKIISGTTQLSIQIKTIGETDNLPPVLAERVVLRQIIENLAVNAVHAVESARPAQPCITISAAERNDSIELAIMDNGIGISPEQLTKIFARGVSTKGLAGKGVGLHFCATSLQAMNGNISVESHGANQGATFRVTLPKAAKRGAA